MDAFEELKHSVGRIFTTLRLKDLELEQLRKENEELRHGYADEMSKRWKLRDNLEIAVDMMDEDTQAKYHKFIKYLQDEDEEDQRAEEEATISEDEEE
jgi:hypothetical protein